MSELVSSEGPASCPTVRSRQLTPPAVTESIAAYYTSPREVRKRSRATEVRVGSQCRRRGEVGEARRRRREAVGVASVATQTVQEQFDKL